MPPPHPTVTIPGTGRSIGRMGLGTMALSLPGRPDRETAKLVIRTAIEAGMTLIDTADAYAVDRDEIGHGERLIAEVFADVGLRIDDGPVVVATKGGRIRDGGRFGLDGRPEHLRAAVHDSLRALGSERITLYQWHSPDPRVPFADSVGALARLREEGKIEALGLSNVSVAQIEAARAIVPIASVQNSASIWDAGYRKSAVVEYCRRQELVFLAYGPLGGEARASRLSESTALVRLAQELASTPQELALAWLLHQAPVVVPIPGASRPSRIRSNLNALALDLDPASLARLRRAPRTLPGHRGLAARVVGKASRLLRL